MVKNKDFSIELNWLNREYDKQSCDQMFTVNIDSKNLKLNTDKPLGFY